MEISTRGIMFDEDKFKELVLYIADKCSSDPFFGAVKLDKALFYSDFLAYAIIGKPITCAEYVALEHGPGPKLLAPIREAMEEAKDIVVQKRDRFGKTQIRVIPCREVNLSVFSAAEVALVDKILEAIAGHSATELSEFSHLEYGWKVAQYKETIPYETVFLSSADATLADKERARELAQQYAW